MPELGNDFRGPAAASATDPLLELFLRAQTPAIMSIAELTIAFPIARDYGITAQSIGVVNPTAATVRLGIGGGAATPEGRGFPVPPNGSVVLPLYVENELQL